MTERKFWPQIDFPDIYVYLVETPSPYPQASLKAYPSRVWMLTHINVAGFVSDIISTKADKNCIIVRAKVKPVFFHFTIIVFVVACFLQQPASLF